MRIFILKVVIFSIFNLILLFIYILLLDSGKFDQFYNKVIKPRSSSLIIGTSRGAVGIDPDILSRELGVNMFNFAFALTTSDYGELYSNAIRKKVRPADPGGIFILEVNPQNLSVPKNYQGNATMLPETNNLLGKLCSVTTNPNLEYLLNCYDKPLYYLLLRSYRPLYAHSGNSNFLKKLFGVDYTYTTAKGRIEIVAPPEDSNQLELNHKNYEKHLERLKPSLYRIHELSRLIHYLKEYGTVILVKTPVDSIVDLYEKNYWEMFHSTIDSICHANGIDYLDYSSRHYSYLFYDGHHMMKDGGDKFSWDLAGDIKMIISKK